MARCPVSNHFSTASSLTAVGDPENARSPKPQPPIKVTTELTSSDIDRDYLRHSPFKAVTSMASPLGKIVDLTQQCAIVAGSTASHSAFTISGASCKCAAAPFRTPRITTGGARARERRRICWTGSAAAGPSDSEPQISGPGAAAGVPLPFPNTTTGGATAAAPAKAPSIEGVAPEWGPVSVIDARQAALMSAAIATVTVIAIELTRGTGPDAGPADYPTPALAPPATDPVPARTAAGPAVAAEIATPMGAPPGPATVGAPSTRPTVALSADVAADAPAAAAGSTPVVDRVAADWASSVACVPASAADVASTAARNLVVFSIALTTRSSNHRLYRLLRQVILPRSNGW